MRLLLSVSLALAAPWTKATSILTTNCNGHCDRFTPCIEQSANDSDSDGVSAYVCQPERADTNGTELIFTVDREIDGVEEIELSPTTESLCVILLLLLEVYLGAAVLTLLVFCSTFGARNSSQEVSRGDTGTNGSF